MPQSGEEWGRGVGVASWFHSFLLCWWYSITTLCCVPMVTVPVCRLPLTPRPAQYSVASASQWRRKIYNVLANKLFHRRQKLLMTVFILTCDGATIKITSFFGCWELEFFILCWLCCWPVLKSELSSQSLIHNRSCFLLKILEQT